jgi:hypothetical protein
LSFLSDGSQLGLSEPQAGAAWLRKKGQRAGIVCDARDIKEALRLQAGSVSSAFVTVMGLSLMVNVNMGPPVYKLAGL